MRYKEDPRQGWKITSIIKGPGQKHWWRKRSTRTSVFCIYHSYVTNQDRLCSLVAKVSTYKSRGPAFDSRPYQIFWEIGGLERGPLSLGRTSEELLEWKSSCSGLENRDWRPWEFVALTLKHPLPTKVGTNFADKLRSLWRYSLLAEFSFLVLCI
jgi:hypothetical protein